MTKDEIQILIHIIEDWKEKIDNFAGGYISTKYSILQDEIKTVLEYLKDK